MLEQLLDFVNGWKQNKGITSKNLNLDQTIQFAKEFQELLGSFSFINPFRRNGLPLRINSADCSTL